MCVRARPCVYLGVCVSPHHHEYTIAFPLPETLFEGSRIQTSVCLPKVDTQFARVLPFPSITSLSNYFLPLNVNQLTTHILQPTEEETTLEPLQT